MSKKINDITTQVRRGYETTGAGTQVDPQAGGEWTQVDTPFRDRQGERIAFLARKTGKGYVFTDDGLCYRDYGRVVGLGDRDLFRRTVEELCPSAHLNGDDALIVYTDPYKFAEGMRAILTAMIAMGGVVAYENVFA